MRPGEADHLPERVLRLARPARVPHVLDRHLPEPDPAHQAAQEPVVLAHAVQLVGHAAVDQAEVAGVPGDVDAGQPVEQAIEERRGGTLERGLPLALLAARKDDLVAHLPEREHPWDE